MKRYLRERKVTYYYYVRNVNRLTTLMVHKKFMYLTYLKVLYNERYHIDAFDVCYVNEYVMLILT